MKRLVFLLALLLAVPALAQPETGPKVAARLVSEDTVVAPGGTVTMALEEKIATVHWDKVENRDPVKRYNKKTLAEHFSKTPEKQHAAEEAALSRLREAKHIGKNADTLDESEKLDTVRHEHDEKGRTYVGYASKGTAGHALYTSGRGKDTKYHVINTCPGQTEGCGGGKSPEGIVDTSKGTCFAPNAESQYVHAAVRRATHEQAKHDPAMTEDWILAHTGSLRNAARLADKRNQRLRRFLQFHLQITK